MSLLGLGDGKMPNSEMMKSTHRYGWKLVCGWLPPAGPIALAFSGVRRRSLT